MMEILGVIGRFLKRSSRTEDENRLEKVSVGKDYLGTIDEEWFDAKATPSKSVERSSKGSTPSASGEASVRATASVSASSKKQKQSRTKHLVSAQGESSALSPPAESHEKTQKEKEVKQVEKSSAEKVEEIMPVLIKLYHLGEELIPLLVTLGKMGDEWSHVLAVPTTEGKERPLPQAAVEKKRQSRPTMVPTLTNIEDDTQLTPTPSITTTDRSRSKEPTSTDTDDGPAFTPSTSTNQDTDDSAGDMHSGSQRTDTGFYSFKNQCATEGMLKRPAGIGEHDVCDGINDDATLQRFFDARKHDVAGAHKQFKDAWDTRNSNKLIAFYERIGVAEFQETRSLYPAWSGRRDKAGQPICLFDFGKLDSKTMGAYRESSATASMKALRSELQIPSSVSTEMLRAYAVYEHLTRFIMPLCSAVLRRPNQDTPVTKMLCIVDLSGIGLKQVWNLRGYIQNLANLFATSYPEILSRVLIIGAPSFFPTIWGWVKKWVDPGTMSKLFILTPDEVLPTLRKYVEMKDIPQRFGGEFEFYHGMQPMVDPVIVDTLSWQPSHSSLPKGPMKWVDEGWGRRATVAIGTDGGHVRNEKIAGLRPQKRSRK